MRRCQKPWRWLRLVRLFWGASVAAEAEYRVNFVIAVLSSLLNLGGSLFALFLFYRTGYRPGGWEWDGALMVLGVYTVLDGVSSACLSPNLSRIVAQVQDGTMDFVLLKPVDAQFWLSTRNLSLGGFPNLLFGLGLIGLASWRLALSWRAPLVGLLFAVPTLAILYSLWFALATLSIWFVKIYNVTFVLRSFLEAGRYPIDAYPRPFRLFFTVVLPVAFLTTVPARAMTGAAIPASLLASLGVAILMLAASRAFWRLALRFYTSASS